MRMNLRQIEVFRAILLSGSISDAAKQLHVSQPAVSRLLSYTEQRLGLKLFERIKGRLYATPEANRLFQEVDIVYQGVQRVNEVAEDLIENRAGHVRIGCSPSLGHDLMPQAITRFYDKYPDARITLETQTPRTLVQSVLTQRVELGIAFTMESQPSVDSQLLYENKMVVALHTSHPLARKNSIHIKELIEQPLIGYSSDIPVGQLLRRMWLDAGLDVRPRTEVTQLHVACALVQAGAGVALIDELTASGPIWTRITVRPMQPTVAAPVSIMHSTFAPLSRMAQAFVDTLYEMPGAVKRPAG